MKDKVKITIEPNHKYCLTVKNGAKFTSVSYDGKIYGGASPCDNEIEVKESILSAIKTIRREGDIPIMDDKRVKQTVLT